MAALLAIAMFVLFAALDYVLSRRANRQAEAAAAPAPAPVPVTIPAHAEEPVWVAGYEMPEKVLYHQGHTWAQALGPDTVAIGIDDFARQLTGPATDVELPAVGSYMLQGSTGFSVQSGDRKAPFLTPVEGEVIEVNPEVSDRPSLVTDEPYGRGWLYKVRCGPLASNLRNLFSGSMARRWMEDTKEQLELRLMALSGSVLQDGGEPAPDFASHLPDADWKRLVERFLLTHPSGDTQ